MERFTVCITDDQVLFRKALVELLLGFRAVRRVFDAGNGHECLQLLAQEPTIQVLLLDVEMPELSGVETAQRVLSAFPDIKIIMLTMHHRPTFIAQMLELGVHSFLSKNTKPEELEQAIRLVMENDFYHNDMIARALRKTAPKGPIEINQPLSQRELQILRLICEDQSAKEIAQTLQLTEGTVSRHKFNMIDKLGVRGTAGLIRWAYARGLFA